MGELGDEEQKHEFKSDIIIFILKTLIKDKESQSPLSSG